MALFDNASEDSGVFNFGVDETAKGYLMETARWTKFLSIVGFVVIGLVALFGIFATTLFSALGSRYVGFPGMGIIMMVMYIVIAVLYFFPTYYLYKFSVLIKPALLTSNQQDFNGALSYLRNMFRFVGILVLVVLSIYALIAIIGIIAAAMS